jgi:hypothetical protein
MTDSLPTRLELGKEYPLPDEPAQIAEILQLFTAMTERKYPPGVRPMRRDAHTKTHGCLKAEFTVLPDIPEQARVGLFRTPATYQAWIRYSNAFSSIASDRDLDVRGMAVKVMGVEGEKVLESEKHEKTQDFLMISHSVFFSPNVKAYVEFSRKYVKRESTLGYQERPDRWKQAGILYRASRRGNVTNPLTTRFWSSVPFALGSSAIKYSATPCGGADEKGRPADSQNFLREAMVAHLKSRDACFDFAVQFQTDPVKMPIEDPSIEWEERDSPFINVAKIHIPAQTFDSPQQMDYAEHLSFTPWHCLPEHRPLGGVNRIRKSVYEQISTLRHNANGKPRREPAGFGEFA